ncbi:MAG: hypothetical protein ABFS86_06350, partial [Planctomycetota bacterium]
MSQETVDSPAPDEARPAFEWTRWKVVTFTIAGLLVLAGGVLAVAESGSVDEPELSAVAAGPGRSPTGSGNALLPGSSPYPGETPGETP